MHRTLSQHFGEESLSRLQSSCRDAPAACENVTVMEEPSYDTVRLVAKRSECPLGSGLHIGALIRFGHLAQTFNHGAPLGYVSRRNAPQRLRGGCAHTNGGIAEQKYELVNHLGRAIAQRQASQRLRGGSADEAISTRKQRQKLVYYHACTVAQRQVGPAPARRKR